MVVLIGLIVFIGLPGVLAAVFMLALTARLPRVSKTYRMVFSALGAGFLPVLPALVAVSRTYGTADLVPFAAVSTLGLIVAMVVGLPSAWLVGRRQQARRSGSDIFE